METLNHSIICMEFIVNKHMNERIWIKLPLSNVHVYSVLGYNVHVHVYIHVDIPSNKWLHTCMEILHLTQDTCTCTCTCTLTLYAQCYMKLMYNTPFYILYR